MEEIISRSMMIRQFLQGKHCPIVDYIQTRPIDT